MIRDRLKTAARKAALRVFGMDRDAEELAPNVGNTKLREAPREIDPSVIPRVVDGSGDTPGPKHKFDIGRTWLASQVISNAHGFVLDIRHPKEVVGGHLAGTVLVPGRLIQTRTEVLPAKDVRITVVDQVGSEEATAIAEWLRDQGWTVARRLVGGYAEWIEHAEPHVVPTPPTGAKFHLGSPVTLGDGRKGWVIEARGADVVVWHEDGSTSGPHAESSLRG